MYIHNNNTIGCCLLPSVNIIFCGIFMRLLLYLCSNNERTAWITSSNFKNLYYHKLKGHLLLSSRCAIAKSGNGKSKMMVRIFNKQNCIILTQCEHHCGHLRSFVIIIFISSNIPMGKHEHLMQLLFITLSRISKTCT